MIFKYFSCLLFVSWNFLRFLVKSYGNQHGPRCIFFSRISHLSDVFIIFLKVLWVFSSKFWSMHSFFKSCIMSFDWFLGFLCHFTCVKRILCLLLCYIEFCMISVEFAEGFSCFTWVILHKKKFRAIAIICVKTEHIWWLVFLDENASSRWKWV